MLQPLLDNQVWPHHSLYHHWIQLTYLYTVDCLPVAEDCVTIFSSSPRSASRTKVVLSLNPWRWTRPYLSYKMSFQRQQNVIFTRGMDSRFTSFLHQGLMSVRFLYEGTETVTYPSTLFTMNVDIDLFSSCICLDQKLTAFLCNVSSIKECSLFKGWPGKFWIYCRWIPQHLFTMATGGQSVMWCQYWAISRQHSDVTPSSSHGKKCHKIHL